MKQLSLSIKQKYFDEIISGEKTEETREIRPKNAARYCEFDDKGVLIGPIKYDRIQFLTGAYTGTRPEAIVEVIDAEIILIEDENGELKTYVENDIEYIEADIVYQLGTIISKPE